MLADGSHIKASQVCDIPICFGPGLCYTISCYVVDNLSNKLVLGMEWLTSFNPTIWQLDYVVDLALKNSVVILHGQLREEKLPTLSLCSAKVACKAICQGAATWFMILCDSDVASLYRVEGHIEFQ